MADIQFTDIQTLAVSVEEACGLTNLSRPTVYKEINAGRLKSFTQGRRRLIAIESLRAWIAAKEWETKLPKAVRRKQQMARRKDTRHG